MKWLIVEDALRDRKGHWLEYVSTFLRGLTALGDEVEVLCDRKAEGFIVKQTGARPVLPESIWHKMGDGAGALRRYARVPGHAWATFVAIRSFFKKFHHGGHREHQVGGKGKIKCETMGMREVHGDAQGTCAVAEFSNPTASEFARDFGTTTISPCSSSPAASPATRHQLPATASPPDWIFVPTVLVHHLLGWWLLIKSGWLPQAARVLLFFPNLPIWLNDSGVPLWNAGPTTKLVAWLFGQLRKEVNSGRVVLGVETLAMQRALESLIRMNVVYMPHPVDFNSETLRHRGKETLTTESTDDYFVNKQVCAWMSQDGASKPDPFASKFAVSPFSESRTRSASIPALDSMIAGQPLVFGCYGAARWEKGSDVLQAAIRLVLQKAETLKSEKLKALDSGCSTLDSLRFVFQWVEDFQDMEGNWVRLDPWLKNHPQVEVIGRYFQGDEYEECLAKTNVILLPYRSPYRLRVSRVVIEAMLHGLPVVATKGTTLFEQAKEHGVVVGCENGSAESLAEAIFEACEAFEMMRVSAMERATMAAKCFSVGYFRELLLNLQFTNKS
jgi:glycosyltransferase involved in cell wall biosynthesis